MCFTFDQHKTFLQIVTITKKKKNPTTQAHKNLILHWPQIINIITDPSQANRNV